MTDISVVRAITGTPKPYINQAHVDYTQENHSGNVLSYAICTHGFHAYLYYFGLNISCAELMVIASSKQGITDHLISVN